MNVRNRPKNGVNARCPSSVLSHFTIFEGTRGGTKTDCLTYRSGAAQVNRHITVNGSNEAVKVYPRQETTTPGRLSVGFIRELGCWPSQLLPPCTGVEGTAGKTSRSCLSNVLFFSMKFCCRSRGLISFLITPHLVRIPRWPFGEAENRVDPGFAEDSLSFGTRLRPALFLHLVGTP